MPGAEAVSFRERLLLIVIYIAVLASSVAFIEPSPHDALMGLLAVACLIAGVRFDRKVAVLFLLLLIWNGGGLLSLPTCRSARRPSNTPPPRFIWRSRR